jgi:hypothetical protein
MTVTNAGGTNNSAFPLLGTPMVDSAGRLTVPWYRMLIDIFRKVGGSSVLTSSTVVIQETAEGDLQAIQVSTGAVIGNLTLAAILPVQILTPVSSPFKFQSSAQGTFVASSGAISLSRDGTNFFPVSLTGGACPMQIGDTVELTWFSSEVPQATFFSG